MAEVKRRVYKLALKHTSHIIKMIKQPKLSMLSKPAEQHDEGPGNGGIIMSAQGCSRRAEQLSEGPGNGGITKSVTGKQGVKRKLEQKTIETKFNAIMEVEKGILSKTEVAKKFGIPKNTLSGWVKKSEEIKAGMMKFGPKRRNMRVGANEDLDKAVLRWFTEARTSDIPISGPQLMEKAMSFANQLGCDDFKASTGWLDRFKERHGITFKKVCGESKSVDISSVDAWTPKLQSILQRFAPSDIYNADETALFYKVTPDKTLEFKSVDCHGGKRSKERITVMVCTNMSGDDKIPLLVIGKSANPRCFKNIKTLPTQYVANKKAWMTSDIFTSWLQKLDRKFHKTNRKIAMIVDNCPAHPQTVRGLTSIELVFLPPNTTSHTQPCDQGIIRNLKVHYRRQVIHKQLQAMENDSPIPNLSVLDALRLLKQSWSMVTGSTIRNCFRHAGFVLSEPEMSDNDSDDDIPISQLVRMAQVDMDSFVDVDLSIPVCKESTDTDILDDIISERNNNETNNTNDDDDDEDNDTNDQQPTTVSGALSACEYLRLFYETHGDSNDFSSVLCGISSDLMKRDFKRRCAKQTTIVDYFKNT